MKKRVTKVFLICATVIFSMHTVSCVDDKYNLDEDNINTDLQIGGDNLTINLGTTKLMSIGELLDLTTPETKTGDGLTDVKTDSEGNYYYETVIDLPAQKFTTSTNLSSDLDIALPDFLLTDTNKLDLRNASIEVDFNITPALTNDATINLVVMSWNSKGALPTISKSGVKVAANGGTYWIGESEEGKPADAEYINLNLSEIINNVPNRIKSDFEITGITSGTEHTVTTQVKVRVPFALGDETDITYEFAEDVEFADIAEYVNEEFILMVEALENSIPLDLKLGITLYDANGDVVSGVTSTTNGVLSGVGSTLDVTIKETTKGALEKVANIRFNLSLTVKAGSDYVFINENNAIQLGLKIKLPGGINVSL